MIYLRHERIRACPECRCSGGGHRSGCPETPDEADDITEDVATMDADDIAEFRRDEARDRRVIEDFDAIEAWEAAATLRPTGGAR